jgi:BirA family biotin operon repressor/biotin-[acetyl-CoA-carboxylase] ligase
MNREATDLAGVRHISFETLGSTNAEALAHARAGERGPLWITGACQRGGGVRRGKDWVSPPGNFYGTLLLSEPSPPALAPQLSFVAALAVYDAVAARAPQLVPGLRLKWPNDLLLAKRKFAGLLIEAESRPVFAVALGIGVNCVSHPSQTAFPATDLLAEGANIDPQRLFEALALAMERRLELWRAGAGFSAIRADWLMRAAGLGETIQVRLPEREFAGRFHGIDEAGHLLIAQSDMPIETIAAGEIFGIGP